MDRVQQAKCDQSPTSAHHWIIPGVGVDISGRCKYCFRRRSFKGVYGSESWEAQRKHTQVIRRSTKLAGQFEPLPESE